MDNASEYIWQVRTYECGPDGRMTLPSICNYLQEAASLNAEKLRFSKSDIEAAGENISWVLARLRIKMDRYPRWEENVHVVTFPRGGRRIVAWRDFELLDDAGARLGVATSEWMLIDLSTRRILPIPDAVLACANTVRTPVMGTDPFTARLRFEAEEGASLPQATFRAQRSHIDMNGHVNNVHYVEWLLEPIPADAGTCRDLELVFRSETLVGDEVMAEAVPVEGGFLHRVASAEGKDHVVARSTFDR